MRKGARGQALVEFALIAPILLLLLFGVIQLGLIMASQNGLVNGVRDAARRAATFRVNAANVSDDSAFNALCGSIETQLSAKLLAEIPGFQPAFLTPAVSYEWQQNPDGTYFLVAHVSATYANPIYVPLVGVVLHPSDPGSFPLQASEQMRVENPSLTAPTTYASGRTCGA